MFRKIYCIHDRVANEVFGPVMVLPNDAVAIRTFRDALFQPSSTNHADYDLYCVGTIDTESGVINPIAEAGAVFGVVPAVVTGAALSATKEGSNAPS